MLGALIKYLSGVDTEGLRGICEQYDIGLLVQPGNGYRACVQRYPFWAGDNGCFTTKKRWSLYAYLEMLFHPDLALAADTCLFITAPDCLHVHADGTVTGDAAATLARYSLWGHNIRLRGFPAAMVAQDGLETMLDEVPWDDLDVLFIGGSTEWKLSDGARRCVEEALLRGKRTHMGRVNSLRRLRLAQSWRIQTADGTFLKYGPVKNLPRLQHWLDTLRSEHALSVVP